MGDFREDYLRVLWDGEELFQTTIQENLYYVNHVNENGDSAYVVGTSGSLRLWHRRMGHLHLKAVRQLAQSEMVEGLALSETDTYDHVREGCTLGKSH